MRIPFQNARAMPGYSGKGDQAAADLGLRRLAGRLALSGALVLSAAGAAILHLPDFYGLYDALSVRRCLTYAAWSHGIAPALTAAAVEDAARRVGLIDFPSELDGRRVLLCWRLGEPSVQFWHDEDAGFSGRQPLSPTLVG